MWQRRPALRMRCNHAVRSALGLLVMQAGAAQAQGVIDPIPTEVPATPVQYEQAGTTVTWGAGTDLRLERFTLDGRGYSYSDAVSRMALEGGTAGGELDCNLFAGRLDDDGVRLAPSFPQRRDPSLVCDPVHALQSRNLDRGVLDLLGNLGPRAGGVERVDYLFNRGALAPFDPDQLESAGHLVAERGGDSVVGIAVVLELDAFGRPSRYGPLVRVGVTGCTGAQPCFMPTALVQRFALLESPPGETGAAPVPTELADDTLAMAFVSSARLGLRAGQRYFGFSLFAGDVDASLHTLTDPGTFPADTRDAAADAGGGLDLYGGLAGYFVADDLASVIGAVFLDSDGNGVVGDGDAGIADVAMTLYRDADGDGAFDPAIDTPLTDSIDSDTGGIVRFHGLLDGTYFLVLDAQDADLPGGLAPAPGSSAQRIDVTDGDSEEGSLNFPLVDPDTGGPGPGTGDDSVTTAVPDRFTINQGSVLDATVLANDTDAAGQGLSIVAISDSPNATLVITGDSVSYAPDPNFVGTDTFTYTVSDAAGAVSTGTVTVSVERFSDINGNDLNDAQECEALGIVCDDLTLETGVHGSGIGGGSLVWLLALGPLAWMRRRACRAGNPERCS